MKRIATLALGTSMLLSAVSAVQQNMAASSPETAKPLMKGATAPDAMLKTVEGKEVALKSVLNGKPTVILFYRGGWCPFCNKHLMEVGQSEAELAKLGYQIVAISPDLPEMLKPTTEKNKLPYQLLSDSKAEALKAFGVAFRLDDNTFSTYNDKYNLNLETWSGQPHHILPVPSVFIVDRKGVIRFSYSNPDYKVRLKAADLIEAAKKAAM